MEPAGTTDKMLQTPGGKQEVLDEFEKTHDMVAKYRQMQHWRAPRLEGIQGIWYAFIVAKLLDLIL